MRRGLWWQVLVVVAVVVAVVWGVRGPGSDEQAPASGPVSVAELPPEARDVLGRIDAGGPFRYDRDGSVFMNRERRLPDRPRGYWREYTVPTPGESDRGARRLVAGDAGEVFYTDDHYASFREVERGSG